MVCWSIDTRPFFDGHPSNRHSGHPIRQELQKEKSHAVDYHRNSHHFVAARFFGWKHQPKLSENRQLDPCSDRYRRHPHHFETVGDRLVLDLRFAIKQVEAARQAASTCQYK